MECKVAGMIGAAAALAVLGSAEAASAAPNPEEILQAKTFAELLQPIPNASVLLAAAESETMSHYKSSTGTIGGEQLAYHHHHHHHHHHRWWRHRHHHHHHHHHHDW